jgi:hypothetical protein
MSGENSFNDAEFDRLIGGSELEPGSSWQPVDMGPALRGERQGVAPTMLYRGDGKYFLYPGKVGTLAGESESGKTTLAMVAGVEQIEQGHRFGFIDFEDDESSVADRLRALGLTDDQILRGLIYLRPDEALNEENVFHLLASFDLAPTLIVIDGVTEGMTLHGLSLLDNEDAAEWLALLPRRLARATGACVLQIDHVVKDKDSRGRYSLGAAHKLNGIDFQLTLETVEPFGRGKDGESLLKLAKDRPGYLRPLQDANGYLAQIQISSDPETGRLYMGVELPPEREAREFTPTVYMEKVSRRIEESPGLTVTDIRANGGKTELVTDALRRLVKGGYVTVQRDGAAKKHFSHVAFRDGMETDL